MSKILVTEETLCGLKQIALHLKAVKDKPIMENGEATEVTVTDMASMHKFSDTMESLQLFTNLDKYNLIPKELSFQEASAMIDVIVTMEAFFEAAGYPIQYKD